jgi:polysaccharide pyruvyl transferase CsaB
VSDSPAHTGARITVMGSYGYGNFGDELMLDGVLAGLRRTVPDAKVTAISGDPEETARMHKVRSVGRAGGAFTRLRRYWELVRSDLLVVGGGNVRDHLPREGRPGPNTLAVWLEQVLMAHEIGVPTMCYAISIGNVLTPRGTAALKSCLDKVDAVSVRDPASATKISELGVRRDVVITADAAFSVIPRPEAPRGRKGVVVCLRHWYEKGNYVENPEAFERMMGEIAAYCDSFVERYNEPIWLVPFKATTSDNDNDADIHRELIARMKHREGSKLLEQVPDVETAKSLFVSARLVIGMRLHSIILATALGAPWVSVNYDPKVRAFARYARQDRFSLEVAEVSSQRLSELESVAIADERAISSALGSVSDELRKLELRNAELACDILRSRPASRGPVKALIRTIRLSRYKLSQRGTREPGMAT